MKLQREKELLEKQMQQNEKFINNRMQKLHQERKLMEEKIVKASVVIQRHARGFIQRLRFKKMEDDNMREEKVKLNNVLNDMQAQIKTAFNVVDMQIDEAATKIQ